MVGQEELTQHYAGGLGTPTIVIANAEQAKQVTQVVKGDTRCRAHYCRIRVRSAVPARPALSARRRKWSTVRSSCRWCSVPRQPKSRRRLRWRYCGNASMRFLVARCSWAARRRPNSTSTKRRRHDRNLIIPVVLAVIFVILILLPRTWCTTVADRHRGVGPCSATLGVCALFFNNVPSSQEDTSFPLFAFVFLVALGVDYNIFLMTRVREESRDGHLARHPSRAHTVTGGVITSAVSSWRPPSRNLTPACCHGLPAGDRLHESPSVLLDTFVIRSTLVPAWRTTSAQIWWPSKLARNGRPKPHRESPNLSV